MAAVGRGDGHDAGRSAHRGRDRGRRGARLGRHVRGGAPAAFAAPPALETREVGGALVLRWAATGRRYFSRVDRPRRRAGRRRRGARSRSSTSYRRGGHHDVPAAVAAALPARRVRGAGCASAGSSRSTRRTGSSAAARPLPAGRARRTAWRADRRARRPGRSRRVVGRSCSVSTASTPGTWLQRLIGRAGLAPVRRPRAGRDRRRTRHVHRPRRHGLARHGRPRSRRDDRRLRARRRDLRRHRRDGLARGARSFLADIEAPSPTLDTPPPSSSSTPRGSPGPAQIHLTTPRFRDETVRMSRALCQPS